TDLLPKVYLRTQIDLADLATMNPGDTRVVSLSGELIFHGVSKPLSAAVLVVKHTAGSATVPSVNPGVINSADFQRSAGLETLRTLASLMSIGGTVPVYFQLHLEAAEQAMPLQIANAPAAPVIVSGQYSAAHMTNTITWQDLSDDETGFMIKRMSNDSFWET